MTSSNAIASAVRESKGNYTITFVTGTFATIPIVTVTPFRAESGNTKRFVVLTSVTTTGFHVKVKNDNDNDDNTAFNFIAIGAR